MPISSWYDAGQMLKRQVPDVFIKKRLNFITIHYLYMIGMSILVSVIIYGIGGMRYIDSLFFASGACTQSGLNTLDIDTIHTGQQVMLYLAAMFCNPIVVHSFVVFIRLYWFEKRFKDVVKEARSLRRSKSRGRTSSTQQLDDPEAANAERSVRGKVIQILRNTGKTMDAPNLNEKANTTANGGSSSSDPSKHSSEEDWTGNFVVQPKERSASDPELRLPLQFDREQHIRILENQRHPRDETTLFIPSPREFDRGVKPVNIDTSSDDGPVQKVPTSPVDTKQRRGSLGSVRRTGTNMGAHITINEPTIVRDHDRTTPVPRIMSRSRTDNSHTDDAKPLSKTRSKAQTWNTFRRSNTVRTVDTTTPYLSYEPTIGRNSFFVNLTEEQREELGGIEYRALKTLALILVVYFFTFHILGLMCLVPWILHSRTYGPLVTQQGQGRVWWGVFTAGSAFNDLGFTLTNNSMISFGTAVFPMLLMTFLIVIGNTGFPCMLRFVIWVFSKCVTEGSGLWEELQFLLDHPRRCFTLLFPRAATWWLFAVLVVLNGLDLMFFVVLDLNDKTITSLAPFIRFIDGLFQASSTRTAGFSVVNLFDLHPAIQVSYLIMMYISVFPIAISMRRTNVYEEKSLGIYASRAEQEEDESDQSFVGAHLRKQLSFDLWYVFLGLFIIAVVEGYRLQDDHDAAFTLFSVLFEIVSAYGTVGLSLGYPTINASFSAEFRTVSKLVIIAMQIRGRHRGLPYELDRAILLPSESLHAKEAAEGHRLMNRRQSTGGMSAVDGVMESDRFRPEIAMTSGVNRDQNYGPTRNRAQTTRTKHDPGSFSGHGPDHVSHVRSGLGNAMFQLASAPERAMHAVGGESGDEKEG